jgi:4-hydroxy-tetrahydrodipicolinate reductase
MKIALIGYGKMGKEIEKIAIDRKHEVVMKISSKNKNFHKDEQFKSSDVAIEFTRPEAAIDNILKCLDANIPVVCGTTGWYDKLSEVENEVTEKKGTLFYASNFSVGVNLFFALNRYLARLMNGHSEYNCRLKEWHHVHKLDKPSGTALSLASDILKENKKYSGWNLGNSDEENTLLQIESIREGEIPGTHEVYYQSSIDEILIRHTAHNRKGFATGAVLAAEWVSNKKGIFTMNDLLKLY